MSGLQFRNVDAEPDDDIATWPYEALVTAIDRGLVPDWRPVFAEIRRSPWGPVARRVERYLSYRDPDGVSTLFALAVARARKDIERADRAEVVARVRAAVKRSGVTQAEFAASVGTSASRLSTYLSGRVTPSAAMLIRIERTAYSKVGFTPDYSSFDQTRTRRIAHTTL
ncbi:MAG: helix-turn-helix transcriptional regulator [Acidimicrobiaceae bacterium]|nr:helix-turn-helix transcriptional regulator [Acidimicrobiaceae bacterium]